MSAPWRLLNQTSSDTELPPLLISTTFTSNSYTVNITDLTYLWSECLDRRSIIKRSLDEDTSIDPSEDAEQLRVFLDKIQSSLLGGAKTSLSLQAEPSLEPNEPPSIDLHATAQLPKGLQPLRWSFHLTLLPQPELSARLTIPILRAQNARMRELEELAEILRDKDHVIQKLVDKLETTGAELGHVFPGAAGKGGRKMPRRLAEERVKGLGAFELEHWKKEMRLIEKENSKEDLKVVVEKVYEEDPSALLDPVTQIEAPGSWLNWWEDVKGDPVQLFNETSRQNSNKEAAKFSGAEGNNNALAEDDDDDFQVQSTPPHLGKFSAKSSDPGSSPPTIRSQTVLQDLTDDDGDLDPPSQRSLVPDSVPLSPPRRQARNFGNIGRSRQAAAPDPFPAPKVASVKNKSPIPLARTNEEHPVVDDDETASEDEGYHPSAEFTTPPTPPKPTSPVAPAPRAPKAGLGKIGGGTRGASLPVKGLAAAAAATEEEEKEETPMPFHRPKHRLGVIGHKASSTQVPESAGKEDQARGRGPRGSKRDSDDVNDHDGDDEGQRDNEPRETSLERADRKREELKRALEEKAKAPAKKKRKF